MKRNSQADLVKNHISNEKFPCRQGNPPVSAADIILNLHHNQSTPRLKQQQQSPSNTMMIGNVALSKGMYLALMKRREGKNGTQTLTPSNNRRPSSSLVHTQQAQTTTHRRTNPHLNKSIDNPTSRLQINSSSCSLPQDHSEPPLQKLKKIQSKPLMLAKIKANKNNEENHNKSEILISKEQRANSLSNIKSGVQQQQSQLKLKEQTLKGAIASTQGTRRANSATSHSILLDQKRQILDKPKARDQIQSQHEPAAVASRNRNLINSSLKENRQLSRGLLNIATATTKSRTELNVACKGGQKPIEQIRTRKKDIIHEKLKQKMEEKKYREVWHEESSTMLTEKTEFDWKILSHSRVSNFFKSVPGYKVKFETSKDKIYAFNCFRDRDVCNSITWRGTINLEDDNDYETDNEQLKESVFNQFQQLCASLYQEKATLQAVNDSSSFL